ncbi:ATP-binding protein [Segatella copri]|uniref:ATP-binding protein n=1 Tax=Segatella copri TaxID=165179 RepID=A0AAW5IBA8_9BACT|nr:ATP-binding protein [Segatella copri]MCP9547500.1 ATP-binding protein [Segatella copri]MCP9548476.1 ATP-binding protein [Segatella copri]MCP9554758.1 ATP-binding protein [Segatella copri]MCP9569393.1 ATP-binding protein [Segatella copri]
MALKLYPVGIQTFERIRKENKLYIDKTEYIYRMTHSGGCYFFLSRPRRFGKSLLVSTFESYFSGKKELFEGLAIEKLEQEWMEYPVLHFDMSGGKHMEKEQLEDYLSNRLEAEERKWGITHTKRGANDRLTELITTAYEISGKQVVVLIDEYDAPMLDVAHDKETLDVLRNVMRNFFSPLKMCEPMLRFVFLTGITKFSQVSIFSELNNIKNVSLGDEYAGVCGITKEELLTQMSEDIDMLAEAQGMTREETIAKLKENYDGYHFSPASPDVFNPYSLLNCFDDKNFGAYWFSSGTPTYLINMLRKFKVLPAKIGRSLARSSAFDAPTENLKTITPLLYQSGYITIKGYDKMSQLFTLDLPNKEIKVGLFESLLPYYLEGMYAEEGDVAIAQMSVLIRQGDMDGALRLFQEFLGTVPYCNNTNYEGHYQQVLFIIFTLLTHFVVDVEVHTPNGRVDVVMETEDTLYLIELKLNKSAQSAMQQINLKQYGQRFARCGKPIVKVGVNFDAKKGNIEDWIIEP